MLRIVFARHGDYLEEDKSIKRAEQLTPTGRAAVRRTAEQLNAEDIRPDLILTTPEPRGQQTAEIIADFYNAHDVPLKGPCAVSELDEGGHAPQLLNLLRNLTSDDLKTIICVSHKGTIGENVLELISFNIAMEVMERNAQVLPTGNAIVLDFPHTERPADITERSAENFHLVAA